MQLQFNSSIIRCLETALQQVKNTEVTQELRLPDGMPDIGRVLTAWGQVIIRSKQWQGDILQVNGGVMLWVLYAPENGTEPRSVDSWIPFQMSWNLSEEKREGPMRLMPLLTFADGRSISARKLMLRAGISMMVQALSPVDVQVYGPGEVPQDVQLLRRTYPLRVPVEGGERTFLIDDELTLPETGANPEKMLAVTVSPEITEKKVMSDKTVFKGVLQVHTVCRYDDGQIRSCEQPIQFSQIAELDTAHGPEAVADIRMAVTSLEAELGTNGVIRIKCGLVAQYLVHDRQILELVQDAFSPHRDLEIQESLLELPVLLDEQLEHIQVEQTVSGLNGRVMDARFLPDHPKRRQTGSGTDLELSGRFQILSYDAEDVLQGTASRWDGELHLCADESSELLSSVRSVGKVQTMSSMDDSALSLQFLLSVTAGKTEHLPMVTGMELGMLRDRDPARPSVILRNGAEEPLWDLAKQGNSTVAAIRSANGLEGEYAPDRMILIPVL